MQPDPDDLAAAALDRDGAAPDATDAPAGSAEDRATLAAYRRVVEVGRSLTDADADLGDGPPADLFDRISAEVADEGPGGVAPDRPDTPPPGPPGDLVVLEERRRRWLVPAAVAAAVLLIGGIIGVSTFRSGEPTRELVASADLDLLAGGGSGTAELVDQDGELHLVVDVEDLTPTQRADFFELWLLSTDPEDPDPQPLEKFETDGTIDVVLPASVDPDRFPVVDISEEVDDGDDSHSGLSILRGQLT